MKDSFNRDINYARISITDSCNLYCQYCRQSNEYNHSNNIEPFKVFNLIDVLDNLKFQKVRFTGGEPLLNERIIDYIKYANEKNNIHDISITTNGVYLDKYLFDMKEAGLKRINISLDTLNNFKYKEMTKTNYFSRVIKNIINAKKMGFNVKLNVVVMKDFNINELENFIVFGNEHDILVRFIELMPIGDNIVFSKKHQFSMSNFIKMAEYSKININESDVADYYQTVSGYVFGIITPNSNHFCQKCNRIRFTNEGCLRLCLHSDRELDLNYYYDDKKLLEKVIVSHLFSKPKKHYISDEIVAKCNMSRIGG